MLTNYEVYEIVVCIDTDVESIFVEAPTDTDAIRIAKDVVFGDSANKDRMYAAVKSIKRVFKET